jgi:deoxyadenosine/deoxycytidine kinase
MNIKKAIIIYGLPCTGKSRLVRELAEYCPISVDSLITKKLSEPEISDFIVLSPELVRDVVDTIVNADHAKFVVEMGCLMPKESVNLLERLLRESGVRHINIILTASNDELIRRITERNRNIDSGLDDSIKISGPDYLTRFIDVFSHNHPPTAITVDTTELPASPAAIKEAFQQHCQELAT